MLPFPKDAAAGGGLRRDIAPRHADIVTSLGRGMHEELRRAGALNSQFGVEQGGGPCPPPKGRCEDPSCHSCRILQFLGLVQQS